MKYRTLGRNGPRVSAVSMGRGAQPIKFGDPLEQDFNAAIHRAIDLGINFFDSSDAYWGSRHEVLLGRALKGRRSGVLIASKFGNIDLPDGRKALNGRPEYVFSSCDASLQRLGVEIIDVYYLHRVDPNVAIEETIGAMARLIEQGKVRWLGICEASPATLKRAHAAHPLVALQTEYSLWFRGVEKEILPACRELGIAFVPYAPLGRGLLTGRIKSVDDLPPNDRRRSHPRFQAGNLKRNAELVRQLEAFAARKNATSAQVAIAWLLAQGEDIVPIPGTNHARNVEQNAAAADIELTAEEVSHLSEVFAVGAGAGERYNPRLLEKWGMI
ncbi:MAG: aldo/keto reductase [Betaproteobacteria bacterium]|nr:aldo/keto reductase [Betaproteobacteria bacterium]